MFKLQKRSFLYKLKWKAYLTNESCLDEEKKFDSRKITSHQLWMECAFSFFSGLSTPSRSSTFNQNGISQIFRISITLHHWWWGAALLNSHWTCRFCFSTPRVPFSEMLYWIFYRWESENWVTSEKKCQKCFKFFLLSFFVE